MISRRLFLIGSVLEGGNAESTTPFQHVYYLFVQPPFEGCRDCYVPMLITRIPIDAAALADGDIENVLILTYERDSIWEIRSDSVPLNRESVNLQKRKLRWNELRYRYQEVSRQEALRLLKNPMGSIPISRPYLRGDGAGGLDREIDQRFVEAAVAGTALGRLAAFQAS